MEAVAPAVGCSRQITGALRRERDRNALALRACTRPVAPRLNLERVTVSLGTRFSAVFGGVPFAGSLPHRLPDIPSSGGTAPA